MIGEKYIKFDAGSLKSTIELHRSIADSIEEFNIAWKNGTRARIQWDFTNLQAGKISIDAVCFFLSISHRIRMFSNQPQVAELLWNPQLIGFLEHIDLFSITKRLDLIDWSFEIGGGSQIEYNPNTKIIFYDDFNDESIDIITRKNTFREKFRYDITNRCGNLFKGHKFKNEIDLIDLISNSCAEMVTNSVIWGRSAAFVGLQRSSKFINLSISDIGIGFKASLVEKNIINRTDTTTTEAIYKGATTNNKDYGLKRVIEEISRRNGEISIFSNDSVVKWGDKFESTWKETTHSDGARTKELQFPKGVKGTRVVIRIPVQQD